jgi:hypothetical protein
MTRVTEQYELDRDDRNDGYDDDDLGLARGMQWRLGMRTSQADCVLTATWNGRTYNVRFSSEIVICQSGDGYAPSNTLTACYHQFQRMCGHASQWFWHRCDAKRWVECL